MQLPVYTNCIHSHKQCAGACTGYSTSSSCPPLIVLAVLSTSPASIPAQVLQARSPHAIP